MEPFASSVSCFIRGSRDKFLSNPAHSKIRIDARIEDERVIWSLVRKPGAFARYVYREEMFPSLVFRAAYDAIQTPHHGTKGDLEYLRILHLAASTMEADVAAALSLLQTAGSAITADAVKAMIAATPTSIDVPLLAPLAADLAAYDALLAEVAA